MPHDNDAIVEVLADVLTLVPISTTPHPAWWPGAQAPTNVNDGGCSLESDCVVGIGVIAVGS